MFLMLFVFIVELVYAIIPKYTSEITALISHTFLKQTTKELTIWNEIKALKDEQSPLSMTDEFVQYSRLQRKVDKLMAQAKQNTQARKQSIAYLKMGITASIYIFHGLLMLILMIYYRNEHLMFLPQDWLTPLSRIVAFPSGLAGALGFGCWVAACNTVIRRGKNLLGK